MSRFEITIRELTHLERFYVHTREVTVDIEEEVFVPVQKQFKEIRIDEEINEEPTCDRMSEHHVPAVHESVLEHNIFEEQNFKEDEVMMSQDYHRAMLDGNEEFMALPGETIEQPDKSEQSYSEQEPVNEPVVLDDPTIERLVEEPIMEKVTRIRQEVRKVTDKVAINDNYEIIMHDRQTLNTYTARIDLKPDLIPLLLKWLSKLKYTVQE
jgi:hypothetical protein